jgi:hypothetical protein
LNSIFESILNGAAIGLLVAAFIYLADRYTKGKISVFLAVFYGAIAFFAVLGLGMGLRELKGRSEASEVVAMLKQQPLFGEVIRRYPESETLLREAGRKTSGMDRTRALAVSNESGRELREKFVVPALRKAPDAAINSALDARREFWAYFKDTEAEICGRLAKLGVPNPLELENGAKALFGAIAEADEKAMILGIEAQTIPPKRSLDDIRALSSKLQLSTTQSAAISNMAAASDRDACSAVNALFKNASQLPDDEKAIMARFLISDGL